MSRLDDLRNLRELLLESLDECPPYSRAPLAAQLRATLAEIDELATPLAPVDKPKNALDELTQRRAARKNA